MHARLDPETWKLLSLECPAPHAFTAAHAELAAPFLSMADVAAATPRTFVRMTSDQVALLADGVRELIPA